MMQLDPVAILKLIGDLYATVSRLEAENADLRKRLAAEDLAPPDERL